MGRMVAPVQPGMDVQASFDFVQWPWAASTSDGSRQRGRCVGNAKLGNTAKVDFGTNVLPHQRAWFPNA